MAYIEARGAVVEQGVVHQNKGMVPTHSVVEELPLVLALPSFVKGGKKLQWAVGRRGGEAVGRCEGRAVGRRGGGAAGLWGGGAVGGVGRWGGGATGQWGGGAVAKGRQGVGKGLARGSLGTDHVDDEAYDHPNPNPNPRN